MAHVYVRRKIIVFFLLSETAQGHFFSLLPAPVSILQAPVGISASNEPNIACAGARISARSSAVTAANGFVTNTNAPPLAACGSASCCLGQVLDSEIRLMTESTSSNCLVGNAMPTPVYDEMVV